MAASTVLVGSRTWAQVRGRPARVGMFGDYPATPNGMDIGNSFTTKLRELGWVEGTNLEFVWRWAQGQPSRYAGLVVELLESRVDVIVALSGVTATNAARRATTTVPIVFAGAADPVKFGLVSSLAHPGGNVTGIALAPLDWGKFLELARESVPGTTRVAIIANPLNQTYTDYVAQNVAAASRLGLMLQIIPVSTAGHLPEAFAAMKAERAQVLVFGPDGLFASAIREIIERAAEARIPLIAPFLYAPELGAFAAYGSDPRLAIQRCAVYVDRILRGAAAGDLPVEQPDHFGLMVNRRVAKSLGIVVPSSVLLRADAVID